MKNKLKKLAPRAFKTTGPIELFERDPTQDLEALSVDEQVFNMKRHEKIVVSP